MSSVGSANSVGQQTPRFLSCETSAQQADGKICGDKLIVQASQEARGEVPKQEANFGSHNRGQKVDTDS